MLTKRGSPLAIIITFLNGETNHKVKIDFKLLEALSKDTDNILFMDLIKRMIKKDPDQRQTCEDLIEHAALKGNEQRLEIVQHLAEKCFDGDECINEYLVKVIDKKEVHMEGALGEDSAKWKKLLVETSKFQAIKPDICSSLLKIFAGQVIIYFWMLTLHKCSYYCICRVATAYYNQSWRRCQTSSLI